MKIGHWIAVAIIPISMLGALNVAHAQDKCAAIYKKYPITARCGKDQSCLQKNMENRKARVAAGCKATSSYKY